MPPSMLMESLILKKLFTLKLCIHQRKMKIEKNFIKTYTHYLGSVPIALLLIYQTILFNIHLLNQFLSPLKLKNNRTIFPKHLSIVSLNRSIFVHDIF